MAVYKICQYLGAFVGGCLGGWLFGLQHYHEVFLLVSVLGVLWLLATGQMHRVEYYATYTLDLAPLGEKQAETLQATLQSIPGVKAARVVAVDQAAYLKIDGQETEFDQLDQFSINATIAGEEATLTPQAQQE